MRNNLKYFLVILPFLFAMIVDHSIVCGTYGISNSEWGSETLEIKRNGLFIRKIGGCLYDTEMTGKREIHKDTLILETIKRKDLRTMREIKVNNSIAKLLIRSDTLFHVNKENPTKTFEVDFALIRKNK
jgi:hypothetical protein